MSTIYYDPDEWEAVFTTGGSGLNQWGAYSQIRRSPEDIARIKAEKRLAHEERVIAEAEVIRAARASKNSTKP